MIGSYWAQIDVYENVRQARFFMLDLAGDDPSVRTAMLHGWQAVSAPLPYLIAKLCTHWSPYFIEIGSNTGFFSLLAASTGAHGVLAIEPNEPIKNILRENICESGHTQTISVGQIRMGPDHTSISDTRSTVEAFMLESAPDSLTGSINTRIEPFGRLNMDINHSFSSLDREILFKADLGFMPYDLVRSFLDMLSPRRPNFILQLRDHVDAEAFEAFFHADKYSRFHLINNGIIYPKKDMASLSDDFTYHLLIPDEKIINLTSCL